jgi:hypothetical protein
MVYTTDDLIAALKRNAVVPSSQRKFSDDDYIAILNEELQLMVTGELMRLNEEFFVTAQIIPLVASQSAYTLPSKAAGWRIRDIAWLDPNGSYNPLPRMQLEYVTSYDVFQTGDHPTGYVLIDGAVGTIPAMGASVVGSLVVYYERLQNSLVKIDECGQIVTVTIVGANYRCVLTSLPVGYTNNVDFVSNTGPHDLLAENKVATLVAPLTIDVPIGVDFTRVPVAGDWMVETGNTPIAHIPAEYNIILAQLGALRYSEASGDTAGVGVCTAALNRMIQKLRERSLNRTKGSPIKIKSKNAILNLMRGRLY